MLETILNIMPIIFSIIGLLLSIAFVVLIIAMPLLIIFAIYKAAKGLMDHNAELKNKDWNDPQNR